MRKIDTKIDFLRVMSMLLVVVIHVANCYCRAFSDISAFSFSAAVTFNAVSRVSVPIFFMISGALLLSSDFSYEKNRKRIISKTLVFIIVTIVYIVWDYFFKGNRVEDFSSLLFAPERAHLWFMYAIIALYIALPFIKRMTDNMDEKDDKAFLILWFVFGGAVSLFNLFTQNKITYPIPIISGTYYLGYFVIGYIIYKNREKLDFKKYNVLYVILSVVSFAAIIALTLINSFAENLYYDSFFSYRSLLCALASVCTFLGLYFNLKEKSSKMLLSLSKNSFDVYLYHGIALDIIMRYLPFKKINASVGVPLFTILIFLSTYAAIVFVKWIISRFQSR